MQALHPAILADRDGIDCLKGWIPGMLFTIRLHPGEVHEPGDHGQGFLTGTQALFLGVPHESE
jgi:hypothetical protein